MITESIIKWFQKPIANALLKAEIDGLSHILPNIFGYYIAQITPSQNENILSSSMISNKIAINFKKNSDNKLIPIECKLEELPFLPESIDAVVLLHTLEFANNPEEVIKEIYDSLIPGGYFIAFNFNPYSMWGINKIFCKNKKGIWKGKWITPNKMHKLLDDCKFEIKDYQTFYFRPPMEDTTKMLFMEIIGQFFGQKHGAAYMYVAQKESTLLLQKTKLEPSINNNETIEGMTKPITRSTQCNQNLN